MIKSMTGYGDGVFSSNGKGYTVEIRSVNHRFVDFSMRLPDKSIGIEEKIRGEIKKRFSRGYFSVFIYQVNDESDALNVNIPLSVKYMTTLKRLKNELNIGGEIKLSHILLFKDIFSPGSSSGRVEWETMQEGLSTALSKLEGMRIEEGKNLANDLNLRLANIDALAKSIEERSPEVTNSCRERLKQRVSSLLDMQIDEARLLMEVTMFAERSNVTEELIRTWSHLSQFKRFMASEEPVGRRMDFLCQEIQREANTIASKANDAEISQMAVDVKGELEKIKEQVQNIE